MKLSLAVKETREITVVHCRGRLVYRNEAAALSGRLSEILPRTRQLVLDLSGVESIDGAGLGGLVALMNTAHATGGMVKLAAPRKWVRNLLQLTNLSSLFEIYPTLEDALVSLGQPA